MNHAAHGTEQNRKIPRESADLSSYHHGTLAGGRVEDSLSQAQ
jgi:hypothetical protein